MKKTITIKGVDVKVSTKEIATAKNAKSSLEYNLIDLAYELANERADVDITEAEAEEIADLLTKI